MRHFASLSITALLSESAICRELRQHMAESGLITDDPIIADGQLHRIHIKGHKPGSRNGYYVLYPDGIPAAAYGDWRTGFTGTWNARSLCSLSAADQQQQYAKQEQARLQREAETLKRQDNTSSYASRLFKNSPKAAPDHSYLIKKGILPHNLRQTGCTLLVPMTDVKGQLWNLQRILPDGTKRFLRDGRIKGCFAQLGTLESGLVYVCEGLATGATIFEQTAISTVCAMNAGNLLPVCIALSDLARRIIICADNDHHTPGNPGLAKARQAALTIGACVTWPDSCGSNCTCTDFNDHANCHKGGATA